MPTHRQRLMELLGRDWFDLKELSAQVGLPIKDVLHHIAHVQRSIRPPRRFLVDPAGCLDCGFVFKDRRKLGPPSRCPRCRSTHLKEPRYRVEH